MRNLGWATDWCGVIARSRYREILGGRGGHCHCNLANGPEDRVYRAGRFITVIRPTIFVVVRMALLVSAPGFVC